MIGKICGVKDIWLDEIPELTKSNINSLYGGSLVLEYLLKKNNYNIKEALKDYKGSKRNMKPVYNVLNRKR